MRTGIAKADDIHRSTLGVDGVTHLQKVLEMGIGILGCLSIERTQSSFQLKAIIAGLALVQSSRNVAAGRGRELTESLLGHG